MFLGVFFNCGGHMKFVFAFEEVKNANSAQNVFLLGNKGAQLCEMTSIGLPVPPGFTISTDACREFYGLGKKWPLGLEEEIKKKLTELEKKTEKKFGGKDNPLFVSVRSGSYVSMPGMMDTVLNVGMNDETVLAFAKQTGNERAAFDSYRRFVNMFGNVVMGIEHGFFEKELEEVKALRKVKADTDLGAEDLKETVKRYKLVVKKHSGKDFPQDALVALKMAVNAVFGSWNLARAMAYRKIHQLQNDAGTAVTVQAMVFGNMGNDSGTGVAFTRNPSTGEKECFGEFLVNAQGEDVVAGIRTPQKISEMKKGFPEVYRELESNFELLEKHYRDMQDVEFTFEKKKLFLLQTRNGKRSAQAAVKIAVDMHKEGIISKKHAIMNVKAEQLGQLLHKQFDQKGKERANLIAKGIPASPGAAVGKAVFSAARAMELAEEKPEEKLILVRNETSAEDIEGMNVAAGILTGIGGASSHAAVIARGMGKCCVAGSSDILVLEKEKKFLVHVLGIIVKEGDYLSLDGSTGEVFLGEIPLTEPVLGKDFLTLLEWTDFFRKLKVRTNADTPSDSRKAREFGAQGIGLTRTEHMFFGEHRIAPMREMILSTTIEERKRALAKLLPFQREDFFGIFKAMDGLPVTIRLLDPPLHEFLPQTEKEIKKIAQEMNVAVEKLEKTLESLKEFNPMLGFRGVRLGIVFPEISQMQVKAIFEAAINAKKDGIKPIVEIMIPVVGDQQELHEMKKLIESIGKEVFEKEKNSIDYTVGVMIELPRACVVADKIAEFADFFSFGTNDLTQTTFGYSRDDSARFIPAYIQQGILKNDPFQTLDQEGVGEMIKIAIKKGRKIKPKLKIGICGEHGGDPQSIEFCHKNGFDYVSCSPFRVPIARLAAAQAQIREKMPK